VFKPSSPRYFQVPKRKKTPGLNCQTKKEYSKHPCSILDRDFKKMNVSEAKQ
jgi:hypothetical protein